MSGAGFTAVDYELFVQKSAAASIFTVEAAQTKHTNIVITYGRGSKSSRNLLLYKASRHEEAWITGAREILKYIFFLNKGARMGTEIA